MFNLQRNYIRNGKGLHIRTILFFILATIISLITLIIPGVIFGIGIFGMTSSTDYMGNPTSGGIMGFLLSLLLSFILGIILLLFFIIPLSYGITKFFKDTDLSIKPKFSDLFMFFKNKRYGKTLKISLIIFAISIAIYFVVYLVSTIIQFIIFSIFGVSAAYFTDVNNMAAGAISMIIAVILMIALMLAIYIPIYYLVIFIYNSTFVHIDQVQLPTLDKIKIGWQITNKGPHSAWKLLFSNLLLIIIYFIVTGIISGLIIFGVSQISEILLGIVSFFIYIVDIVIFYIMMYIMFGSVINFYHKNKEALYPTRLNTNEYSQGNKDNTVYPEMSEEENMKDTTIYSESNEENTNNNAHDSHYNERLSRQNKNTNHDNPNELK